MKNSCVKNPELLIKNKKINVKDQKRFLGIIFDKKLSFLPHIKDLKIRCLKALNAFKIFSTYN